MPSQILNSIGLDFGEKLSKIESCIDKVKGDIFLDYFQNELSNRKKQKQEFTPVEVAKLVSDLSGRKVNKVLDVCGGTGSLTLALADKYKDCVYYIEEYSSTAIAFLLINLAIRNVNAYVYHMDVLTREVFGLYKVGKSDEKYSTVEKVESTLYHNEKFDLIISNPPFSMKWNGERDERFEGFEIPPKSKADYAFVIHAIDRLNEGGRLLLILPHGALFRGNKEGDIREALINNGYIKSVIGLPDNLFQNTGIPVCIIEIIKNNGDEVLFIDASKEFEKVNSNNRLREIDIDKIVSVHRNLLEVERYSHLASIEEIKENGYNLNIPRYVDTYIPEEVKPIDELFSELLETEKEMIKAQSQLLSMIKELEGGTKEANRELERGVELLEELTDKKKEKLGHYDQMRWFFND